jgi:hypothetical protein
MKKYISALLVFIALSIPASAYALGNLGYEKYDQLAYVIAKGNFTDCTLFVCAYNERTGKVLYVDYRSVSTTNGVYDDSANVLRMVNGVNYKYILLDGMTPLYKPLIMNTRVENGSDNGFDGEYSGRY